MSFSVLVNLVNNDKNESGRTTEWRESLQKRGDILEVRPISAAWGRRESLKQWLAQGLPADEFPRNVAVLLVDGGSQASDVTRQKLCRTETRLAEATDVEYDEEQETTVIVHKNVWRVRLSELSADQKQELHDNGELRVSLADFRALCEHKVRRTVFDPSHADGFGAVRSDADEPLKREEADG